MTEELIGRTGAPFEMRVESGKVREFARAIDADCAEYLTLEPAPVSPPTFLTTARFWQDDTSSPWQGVELDLRRTLHAEQEFVFPHGPPEGGDVLQAQSRISDVRRKQGRRGGEMTFYDVVTDFRNQAGELVAQSRSTAVVTSRAPEEES